MINNTVVGNGDGSALVHLVNANSTFNRMQSVRLVNNAFIKIARISWIDRPALSNWSITGANNWVAKGTSGVHGLAATVFGSTPGVRSLVRRDLVPAPSGDLIGRATTTLPGLPVREYDSDEAAAMRWRFRAAFSTSEPSNRRHPVPRSDSLTVLAMLQHEQHGANTLNAWGGQVRRTRPTTARMADESDPSRA
jgi:hypothetical protein